MGLTKNGIEKTPIEVLPDAVVVKIASGSDHIACLTDFGELYTLGKKTQICISDVSVGVLQEFVMGGNSSLEWSCCADFFSFFLTQAE